MAQQHMMEGVNLAKDTIVWIKENVSTLTRKADIFFNLSRLETEMKSCRQLTAVHTKAPAHWICPSFIQKL